MEMPTIEQGYEKVEQKNPFEILTAELAGKTRDELTLEQRETEEAFREKAFRDLMHLINDDKVLSHGTGELNSVLTHGILSARRLRLMDLGTARDASTQENARDFTLTRVDKFFKDYTQWKQKLITDEEFYQKRQQIINEFPEIGRERVIDYFENILPRGVEEGWFDNLFYTDGGYTDKGVWQKMNLSEKKQFLKAFRKENLAGMNTVSTIGPPYFKKEFVQSGYLDTRGAGNSTIFFNKPTNKQIIEMSMFYGNKRDTKEEDSFDIGVFAKVNKNNFRAIELNTVYDETKRVLRLSTENQEIVKELIQLQKQKEISIFSNPLVPLPPLESIALETKDKDVDGQNKQQTQEKIKALIEENHWDWYEKYGKKAGE